MGDMPQAYDGSHTGLKDSGDKYPISHPYDNFSPFLLKVNRMDIIIGIFSGFLVDNPPNHNSGDNQDCHQDDQNGSQNKS